MKNNENINLSSQITSNNGFLDLTSNELSSTHNSDSSITTNSSPDINNTISNVKSLNSSSNVLSSGTTQPEIIGLSFNKDYIIETRDFVAPDNVPENQKNIYIGFINEIRIYQPNADIEYYLYTDVKLSKELTITVEFTNNDFKTNITNRHVLSANKGTQVVKGKFQASKNGIYNVRFYINDGSEQIFVGSKNIGIMPKTNKVASKEFYFGVQPFLIRPFEWNGLNSFDKMSAERTYNLTWSYIDYLGANLVRDGEIWASMQADEGMAVDFKYNDRLVNDCQKRSVILDWTMGGVPAFGVDEKYANQSVKWNLPPSKNCWDDYLTQIGNHYKNNADDIMFEIINEPNWEFFKGTPQEFVTLLDGSARLLKSINQKFFILPGGMVLPKGDKADSIYYTKDKQLLDENLIASVPFHSHQNFDNFMTDIKAYKNFTDVSGINRKFAFLNESGYSTENDQLQMQETMRKALWSNGNNLEGFVLFSFRGFSNPGGEDINNWGAITKSNEIRSLYISYGIYIQKLNGAKVVKKYANDSYYAYLYEKDGKSILVQFKENKSPAATLNIKTTTNYRVYDLIGNEVDSGLAETFGNSPVYIEFDGIINVSDITVNVPTSYSNTINFAW